MKVRKRDGKLQQFNCEKIYDAICAALESAKMLQKRINKDNLAITK